MQKLVTGEFFGEHKHEVSFDNFLLTDTEYTHEKVDWHYHENPYFTFLLNGKLFEENKKEAYYLKPRSLLFHNWQDAHHNRKPPEYTRGFHIELTNDWFHKNDISSSKFEGSISIENPIAIQQMNSIVLESKICDPYVKTSIELSILNIFENTKDSIFESTKSAPKWVNDIKSIINDEPEICKSLSNLSSQLNVHPVHISREFPKYFKTSLGNYLRLQKVNKAVTLILSEKYSMTEIAYLCGFYDQSHFTNSFKKIYGRTPLAFLKKMKNVNSIQF